MSILEEPWKGIQVVKNYIGGEWVDSKGERVDIVNPANQRVIGTCPISTKDEIDAAVAAAQEAFPSWRETTPLARVRCLFRMKEILEERFEEVSRVQTMEHGKTIDESRGETRRGIENVEVATGIPTLMMGYNLEDIAEGIDEYTINQPLGVFGIIGPFNFPFMIPLWFAPYAVATGNTVVIKPSSEDPVTQIKIAEIADEAGFPPGVWNVVNGGRTVVNGMLEHPDIKGICFVGSTPTAKEVIYPGCGKTGKRVIAQAGAKCHVVVMPDADLARTIPSCMTSFFGNAGQRCLAGSVLVVCGEGLSDPEYESFYRKVVDAYVGAASKIRVGYGLDETVQMGPLRDKGKKQKMLEYIQKGIDQGADLALDGRNVRLVDDLPHDAFLNPTVFKDVAPDMYIGREELFGPITSIMRTRNLNATVELLNDNRFGNADAIFTSNGKWAREFQYRVRSGNIGINVGIVAPMAFFPFSGMKDSFFGVLHGQGKEAIRFFTESKVVIQRWF